MSGNAEDSSGSAAAVVPVPQVLSTLSHEVRVLSDSVNDLQDLVGNLVDAGAFGNSHSLYELQCLDTLSQNLDAIADYLRGISEVSHSDWKVDVVKAARSIKLEQVRERLNGFKCQDCDDEPSNAGDFEDFALTG